MDAGFNNKLIAEYNELASAYLDKIKINDLKDFEAIKNALSILISENRVEVTYPELMEKIKEIKELIDHPELYVKDSGNYSQYQTIIKTRVLAKIHEIEKMPLGEKQKWIKQQQEQRKEAEKYHKIQAQATQPEVGSERHSITEEQMLAEMEEQFIQEGLVGDYAYLANLRAIIGDLDDETRQNLPQILSDLSSSITREELSSLPSEFLFRIIDSHEQVIKLLNAGVSLNALKSMSDDFLLFILQNTDSIIPLLQKGITLQQIAETEESELEYLFQMKDIKKYIQQGDSIHQIFLKAYRDEMEKRS